ncbi:DUF4116 domain-containing protein [Variovorax sp. RA8]|uniref:DUF4116 domain-containing protein n=1 Tax=Variovorax sp. (strain JCM 16519 / RA8) TaxID=662548 RepID=UPI000A653F38|nr:DUF4116 domain-containing protein [Variovorax sp. RA8]VTU34512.1 hypothetical protein RA8CHR_04988 [Variovorax sp. RA8]
MALYKTKETALKHLKNNQSFSCKVFDLFREDMDVVREAVIHDKWAQIPSCFADNKELALHSCSRNPFAFKHFSPRVRSDREVLIAALKSQTKIPSTSIDFNDWEMVAAYVSSPNCSFGDLPAEILSSASHVVELVKNDSTALASVPYHCLDNEAFMKTMMEFNIHSFQYASERLRNSVDFVLPYCTKHPLMVWDLGNELKNNKDFITHLLESDKAIYNYLPLNMRGRKSFARYVADNPETHHAIPSEILDDDGLVDLMVQNTYKSRLLELYTRLPATQKMRLSIMEKVFVDTNSQISVEVLPVELLEQIGFAGSNWRDCPSNGLHLLELYRTAKLKDSLDSKLSIKEDNKRKVKI